MKENRGGAFKNRASIILMIFLIFSFFSAGCPFAEEKPSQEFSSVEERRLIEATQEERENFREEKEDLELKKKELKTLEEGVDKKLAEIDVKIAELKKQQKILDELLTRKSAEELKKTEDLARIFEKMSPDKAALALSGLNQKLAADLLAKMKVKAAAKILDQISKQKATDLSTTFSTIQLE
jgi:flagellar motility protein MotE (MotC chaperone)